MPANLSVRCPVVSGRRSRDLLPLCPGEVAATTSPSEDAWHRNLRTRRQRARRTILLWKSGCSVAPLRLREASSSLANHHGTRGSDPMAGGGNGKNARVFDIGGGYSHKGRNIKPDEWLCPNGSCQKDCPDPRGYYVFANNVCCNRCQAKKPKVPRYYHDSDWAKSAAAGPTGWGWWTEGRR